MFFKKDFIYLFFLKKYLGSGNVSQGAQEIFQELPHEYVLPSMLEKVAKHGSSNKLYACEVLHKVNIF